MKTRILGQEVQVRMSLKSTGRLASITAVKNFSCLLNLKIITEGYLGEKQNRKDAIFEDVSGSFLVHPEDPEVFLFMDTFCGRAINRSANGDEATLSWKYTFPNGRVATFTIPEPEFGAFPITAGGRDTFLETPFTWEASKYLLNV